MMLKLPVEEAVSDMTISTWACQSKFEGAEKGVQNHGKQKRNP